MTLIPIFYSCASTYDIRLKTQPRSRTFTTLAFGIVEVRCVKSPAVQYGYLVANSFAGPLRISSRHKLTTKFTGPRVVPISLTRAHTQRAYSVNGGDYKLGDHGTAADTTFRHLGNNGLPKTSQCAGLASTICRVRLPVSLCAVPEHKRR